jgi:exonuclease SbcC
LIENLKRQEELILLKQNFQDVQRKNIEKKVLQESSKQLLSQKENKQRIITLIKEYKEVKIKIEDKQKDLNEVLSQYELIRIKISSEKIEQSGLEFKTNDYEKQVEKINSTLIELPELSKNITAIESKIKKFNENLDLKNADLKKKSDQIESLESYIKDLQVSISNIKHKDYPSEFDLNFVKYTDSLNKIKDTEFKIKKANGNLQLIEDDIFQQESFQSELESFIAKGLSIVNEKKTESCPLCSQKYNSYNLLADKIANNESLSNFLNVLLTKKTDTQVEINELLDTLEKSIEAFVKEITKDLDNAELQVIDLNKENLETRKEIINLNSYIKNETANLVSDKDRLLYKSSVEYVEWASLETERLSSELSSLIKQLANKKNDLKTNTDQNELNAQKIEQFKNDKKNLEINTAYIEVKDYFIENYPEKEITVEIVNEDIEKDVKKQEELDKSIEKVDIEINRIERELVGVDENIVNANLEEVAKSIVDLSSITEYYKTNAAKIDGLNFEEIEPEKFHQIIVEKRLGYENQIVKYEEEKNDLKLLSQLKDNVLPYLKFEESKQKASDIKKRITVLRDKVGSNLKDELSKVSKHIEKQIKSFFFEELINDLYKRIDPHPDYRKVKFKPDFKEAKPKLNVCVYNENDETDFIIPNLYFSHAQLNILSLCIFLAKALNAKDDKNCAIDCIFVDDPIQSMDSINILSTIDLLRSIVVNQKKQIILSTHDENFHNLLKKKIPSNLFNSKFMELETFGKIKLD